MATYPAWETGEAAPGKHTADELPPRLTCNICGTAFSAEKCEQVRVVCNIRRFANESFHVWRCARCRCLHCRERVELDRYYAAYPTQQQRLDWFARIAYGRLLKRFRAAGLKRGDRLLDYGCGSGNFVRYLRLRGYSAAEGYDPYGGSGPLNDPAVFDRAPFDFCCLQDVIEHVEEPRELLARLHGLLRPGGGLLVGTPSADEIDLKQTHRHKNHLHAPYHLHIYTQRALAELGQAAGFEPGRIYHQYFVDTPIFGMNEVFWRAYQAALDDSIDALAERLRVGLILRSPRLLFHGTFGYFYRPRHCVTIVFRRR